MARKEKIAPRRRGPQDSRNAVGVEKEWERQKDHSGEKGAK
jgi:hypothetical protein